MDLLRIANRVAMDVKAWARGAHPDDYGWLVDNIKMVTASSLMDAKSWEEILKLGVPEELILKAQSEETDFKNFHKWLSAQSFRWVELDEKPALSHDTDEV